MKICPYCSAINEEKNAMKCCVCGRDISAEKEYTKEELDGTNLIDEITTKNKKNQDKKKFKKVLYAFFSERACKKILYILRLTNYKFSRFILGQSTDGIILGTTFFIVFSMVKIPYALLISIMIPILNFIPIFGTYVGIVISMFIILMAKPSSVILFLVLIITIQQLDGKFVYPVVVGNSLGLSSLWILLAIIVGGNLFGVLGMVLGMPLVSVIYDLFSEYVNKRIEIKRKIEK